MRNLFSLHPKINSLQVGRPVELSTDRSWARQLQSCLETSFRHCRRDATRPKHAVLQP